MRININLILIVLINFAKLKTEIIQQEFRIDLENYFHVLKTEEEEEDIRSIWEAIEGVFCDTSLPAKICIFFEYKNPKRKECITEDI